jgi:hypothetical protein
MRRCLLAFMLVLGAVGGLAPAARAETDPVSTWYQQVAEWRLCVRGVISLGGTIDAARTQCGAEPTPPADARLERFRQAIKDWRACVREQLAKGVHGAELRAACPMPMLADFGLPKPPEPPKPAWVEPYRQAHKAWEDCLHAQREAGHTIDEARAACGPEPTPDQFGGPGKHTEPRRTDDEPKPPVTTTVAPGDRELAMRAFRVCVELQVKAGAAIQVAYQACKEKLPPGVEPPIIKERPIEPPTVTEPKRNETPTSVPPTTVPPATMSEVAARFRRCIEERTQQGLSPAQGYASCVASAPAGFVPPPAPG